MYFPENCRFTGQSLESSRVWPTIRLVSTSWRKLHFQIFYYFRSRKNFFEIIPDLRRPEESNFKRKLAKIANAPICCKKEDSSPSWADFWKTKSPFSSILNEKIEFSAKFKFNISQQGPYLTGLGNLRRKPESGFWKCFDESRAAAFPSKKPRSGFKSVKSRFRF